MIVGGLRGLLLRGLFAVALAARQLLAVQHDAHHERGAVILARSRHQLVDRGRAAVLLREDLQERFVVVVQLAIDGMVVQRLVQRAQDQRLGLIVAAAWSFTPLTFLFPGFLAIIVFPVIGAFATEIIAEDGNLSKAFGGAMGSLLGFFLTVGFKFALIVWYLYLVVDYLVFYLRN